MRSAIRIQLSVMMFLQFFIWGAWYVTMGTYLFKIGFEGTDVGSAYSCAGWAAILSPFFVGMVADRFFSAEKVLGIMHLLGAALLFSTTLVTDPGTFFWVLLAYTLCYMPTLALTNAIAFEQMKDPGQEFPAIRVLGTLGWIVAGLAISAVEWSGRASIESTSIPFKIAAVASVLLGVYSFFLPNTPPKASGRKITFGDIIGAKALGLLKERSFAVFVISSLLICIPLSFYYAAANVFLNESGMEGVAAKMSLGQMSEVAFMLVMPFFFVRLGVKKMLLIGMVFWAARYVLFAFGNSGNLVALLYGGILFHGICYDFFFVTGQIYVDKKAPKEIRASAQGFLALVTYGVGMVIGANIAGRVLERFSGPLLDEAGQQILDEAGSVIIQHAWKQIWLIPAAMATVVIVFFVLLFKENGKNETAVAVDANDASVENK